MRIFAGGAEVTWDVMSDRANFLHALVFHNPDKEVYCVTALRKYDRAHGLEIRTLRTYQREVRAQKGRMV